MKTDIVLGEIVKRPSIGYIQLLPSRPKGSGLDHDTDPHGFIYVLRFDNETVKVGRTQNPRERIGHHFEHGHKLGLAMTHLWCSPAHRRYEANEKNLINRAADLARGRTSGTEYFSKLLFLELIQHANKLDFSRYTADELKAIADERRDREPAFGSGREPEVAVADMLRVLVDKTMSALRAAEEAKALAASTASYLDALLERNEWHPAITYAQLNGIADISKPDLEMAEREAAAIASTRGLSPVMVPHELLGNVNLYPAWVWEMAFDGRGAA